MLSCYTIPAIEQHLYLDHLTCHKDAGVLGAFAVILDRYQLDELTRNGYTLVTEDCCFCKERSSFVLRAHPLTRLKDVA